MSADGLQVTGGAGGVTARLSDLRLYADRCDRIGDEVREVATTLARLAVDGDLVASAVLSPASAARAEGALVDVHARVAATSARLEASARGLRTVADAWAAMDHASAVATDVGEVATFGSTTVGGIGGSLLSAPFVFAHNLGERTGDAVGDGLAHGWGALWDGLVDAPSGAGGDTLGDIGGFWSDLLVERPQLTDAVVEGLGVVNSFASGRPLSYEDMVVGLLGMAGLAGWFDDSSPVTVRTAPVDDVPPHQLVVPGGIEDLFRSQGALMALTADDPSSSRLRVIEVGTAGAPAWVVQIPGTQEWAPTAGGDPSDLTTNLHLTGPEDAALLDAVSDALALSGAGGDDPVMVVGHSQGGIAAVAFAAQADQHGVNVTHVVTGGSPVAHLDVPDDVQVLSLEHHQDPVPRLDGDPNPDRPNWTTVVRELDDDLPHPGVAHGSDLYTATGARVDGSDDPSVQAFLDGAQVFLSGTADPHTAITDVTIQREAP